MADKIQKKTLTNSKKTHSFEGKIRGKTKEKIQKKEQNGREIEKMIG